MDAPTTVDEVVVTAPRRGRPTGLPVYTPRVSVILKKNLGRKEVAGGVSVSDRVSETRRQIDLTPLIGEGNTIHWSRSTRGGAGAFTFTVQDALLPGLAESAYGLIEPMDVIEIRAARDSSASSSDGGLPIQMRGFVSTIARETTMTQHGPQRVVTVSGHDYGKILEVMRVAYLPGMVLGQDLLSSLKLFLNYGPEAKADQPASEFIKEVVEKVVNAGFLAKLRAAAGGNSQSPVLDLKVDATVNSGIVSPFGSQEWPGGTVRDLLALFGDVGPWNEMFVEDRDDGPYLVYRPNPFKTADGAQIQDGPEPKMVDIFPEDIVALHEERSDDSVSNYFWVDAPRYALTFSSTLRLEAQEGKLSPDPFLKDYQNSSPEIFGIRMMMVETQQGARLDGQREGALEKGNGVAVADVADKRRILIESNKDNVVLERGSMRMKGSERLAAGVQLRVRRGAGDLYAELYAHTLTQTVSPFSDVWMAQVTYDRGTGFIERTQRGGGASSPYLAELNMTGAYGG